MANGVWIKRVKSNIKAGVDVELGPRTLIVGPRASGKSSVSNAVELALTGRIDDVAGRASIALPAELLSLAPPREDLEALLEFSDGAIATTVVERTAAGGKKPKAMRPSYVDVDTALPVRKVVEALTAGPDRIRRFLFPIVVGRLTLKMVEEGIPAPLRAHFKQSLSSIPTTTPPVDALLSCLDAAEQEVRSCGDRLRGSKKTLESASNGLPPPATSDELAAAKAAVGPALAALEAAQREHALRGAGAKERIAKAEKARERLASEKEKLTGAQQAVEDAKARLAGMEALLASLPRPGPLPKHFQDALAALQSHPSVGDCYVCASRVDPANWDVLRAQTAGVMAQREALANDVLRAEGEVGRARADLLQREEEARRVDAQIASYLRIIGEGEAAVAAPPESLPDLDALRGVLQAATAAVTHAESSRAAWGAVERAQSEAIDAERQQGEWRQLAEACSALVERFLDSAAAAFMKKVQARLPADEHFVLQLRDGKRECVRVGLKRGGQIHTALSGGEWMLVVAAVADAIAEDGAFSCIRPEDRGIDPTALSHTLEALSQCQSQVIVTSTVKPTRVPPGWTVIDTGRSGHRKALENRGDSAGVPAQAATLAEARREPTGVIVTHDAEATTRAGT